MTICSLHESAHMLIKAKIHATAVSLKMARVDVLRPQCLKMLFQACASWQQERGNNGV